MSWIDPQLSDADVAAVLREQFVILTWTVGDRDLRERLADTLTAAVMTEVVRPLRAELDALRLQLRQVIDELHEGVMAAGAEGHVYIQLQREFLTELADRAEEAL